MGTIVEFKSASQSLQRKTDSSNDGTSGEIIIFPGVRVEYLPEDCAVSRSTLEKFRKSKR